MKNIYKVIPFFVFLLINQVAVAKQLTIDDFKLFVVSTRDTQYYSNPYNLTGTISYGHGEKEPCRFTETLGCYQFATVCDGDEYYATITPNINAKDWNYTDVIKENVFPSDADKANGAARDKKTYLFVNIYQAQKGSDRKVGQLVEVISENPHCEPLGPVPGF